MRELTGYNKGLENVLACQPLVPDCVIEKADYRALLNA